MFPSSVTMWFNARRNKLRIENVRSMFLHLTTLMLIAMSRHLLTFSCFSNISISKPNFPPSIPDFESNPSQNLDNIATQLYNCYIFVIAFIIVLTFFLLIKRKCFTPNSDIIDSVNVQYSGSGEKAHKICFCWVINSFNAKVTII